MVTELVFRFRLIVLSFFLLYTYDTHKPQSLIFKLRETAHTLQLALSLSFDRSFAIFFRRCPHSETAAIPSVEFVLRHPIPERAKILNNANNINIRGVNAWEISQRKQHARNKDDA